MKVIYWEHAAEGGEVVHINATLLWRDAVHNVNAMAKLIDSLVSITKLEGFPLVSHALEVGRQLFIADPQRLEDFIQSQDMSIFSRFELVPLA